jgi:hypothetical protein
MLDSKKDTGVLTEKGQSSTLRLTKTKQQNRLKPYLSDISLSRANL